MNTIDRKWCRLICKELNWFGSQFKQCSEGRFMCQNYRLAQRYVRQEMKADRERIIDEIDKHDFDWEDKSWLKHFIREGKKEVDKIEIKEL